MKEKKDSVLQLENYAYGGELVILGTIVDV